MRWMAWILLGSVVCGMAGPAEAGDFWKRMKRDYERTKAWPEPFVHRDREAVRAPWEVMKHNGWRAQNTLTEDLFTEDAQLTEAGRHKVIWIATQAPEERRTVYVLATHDLSATEARTSAVKNLVTELQANGVPAPELMMTSRRPLRWHGDYFDRIEKMNRESITPPVLPKMKLTTEG